MSRIETIGDATLYLADCREIIPTIGAIDAIITSPPYDQQRNYEGRQLDWKQTVCNALVQTHPDAQVLVNLGLVHRDGYVIRYWDAMVGHMEANGWRLFGWYVWDQCSGLAGDWNGRLAPSFEFVFHFNQKARVVRKTKPTKGGKQHGPNMKAADGGAASKSHKGKEVQPFKIPDSVIRTPRETQGGPEAEHPARYPIMFAKELISPFSDPRGIVCDPFMGSGTTGAACMKLGRRFIGIEIEPKYFDIACRRIEEATRQGDMFIEPARPVVQEPML